MQHKEKLFSATDHLVSGRNFDVVWQEKNAIAQTLYPPGTNLNSYYESEEYDSHKNEQKSVVGRLYLFAQNVMFAYKKRIIKNNVNGKSLLDYGAGVGNFTAYLKGFNYKVMALEPNKKASSLVAEKGISCVHKLEDLSTDASFDAITLWHVLEHLEDPKAVLQKLKNHLNQEGVLVLAAPNFNSPDAKYYNNEWAALDVPRHLWHFTSKGLITFTTSCGYKHITNYPLFFDAFYVAYLSERNKGKKFPLVKGLLIGLLSNLKALFSKEYSSIIFVFRKA